MQIEGKGLKCNGTNHYTHSHSLSHSLRQSIITSTNLQHTTQQAAVPKTRTEEILKIVKLNRSLINRMAEPDVREENGRTLMGDDYI